MSKKLKNNLDALEDWLIQPRKKRKKIKVSGASVKKLAKIIAQKSSQ